MQNTPTPEYTLPLDAPQWIHPPPDAPPPEDAPPTSEMHPPPPTLKKTDGQLGGSTHPTGMYSCLAKFFPWLGMEVTPPPNPPMSPVDETLPWILSVRVNFQAKMSTM